MRQGADALGQNVAVGGEDGKDRAVRAVEVGQVVTHRLSPHLREDRLQRADLQAERPAFLR